VKNNPALKSNELFKKHRKTSLTHSCDKKEDKAGNTDIVMHILYKEIKKMNA